MFVLIPDDLVLRVLPNFDVTAVTVLNFTVERVPGVAVSSALESVLDVDLSSENIFVEF